MEAAREAGIRYFVDPLPGNRGQMRADLLNADGGVEVTYPVGSPAPIESVRAACEANNGEVGSCGS